MQDCTIQYSLCVCTVRALNGRTNLRVSISFTIPRVPFDGWGAESTLTVISKAGGNTSLYLTFISASVVYCRMFACHAGSPGKIA